MRSTRRVITLVLVLLLLGATINVAVAWGSALWVDAMPFAMYQQAPRGYSTGIDAPWRVTVWRGGTSTVVTYADPLHFRRRQRLPMRVRWNCDAGRKSDMNSN